jgi:hypothetical protein
MRVMTRGFSVGNIFCGHCISPFLLPAIPQGAFPAGLILFFFIGANPEHLPERSKTVDSREESNTSYHKCNDPEPSCYWGEYPHNDSYNSENEP